MKAVELRAINNTPVPAGRRGGFKFTLIEIIVVVAIIGILLCLIFPAFAAVKDKSRKALAQADITSLLNACLRFEADYGGLPNVFAAGAVTSIAAVDSSNFAKANSNTSESYVGLLSTLTGFDYLTSTVCPTSMNPRGTKYLQVPQCYSFNLTNNPDKPSGFIDPWGNTYGIALDIAGSGQTSVAYPNGLKNANGAAAPVTETTFSRVAIYSLGSGVQWESDGRTLKASNSALAVKSWK